MSIKQERQKNGPVKEEGDSRTEDSDQRWRLKVKGSKIEVRTVQGIYMARLAAALSSTSAV